MVKTIELPRLDALQPTLESTLLKIVEESGELARAVLAFLPYEKLRAAEIGELRGAKAALAEVSGELLDVAQTCVTMVFVLEEKYAVNLADMLKCHLEKLAAKGYAFDLADSYIIEDGNRSKRLALPELRLNEVTLLTTVCKIQEELGEFTQYLGKKSGASGEREHLKRSEAVLGSALELLDVAQCCFTMMYILAGRYGVDIEKETSAHIEKLRRKGYCK
jgi:NTP pyrophosphatase (non-canonical NTP hydrolase)